MEMVNSVTHRRATNAAILREHACLLWVIGGYCVAAYLYARWTNVPVQMSFLEYFNSTAMVLFTGLVFIVCWYFIYVMIFIRPHRLTIYVLTTLKSEYLTRERLVFSLPVLILIPVFASTFTFFKSSIGIVTPYRWDVQFAQWDKLLHGGVQPWELLQPVLGSPFVTGVINLCYHLWFFVMYGIVFWQAFSFHNPQLRMQLFLSFVLSWATFGTIGAILFASVGPCYYGHVIQGDNPYAALMEYLYAANSHVRLWALDVQQMLWNDHQHQVFGLGSGISAMPSMHVGTAVLLACFGWRINRLMGIALTVFAIIIMIGSVHLAWHYAIDGYVGGLGAGLVWVVVGKFLASSRVRPTAGVRLSSGEVAGSVV